MPVVEDHDRPRGRLLVDAAGAPLARFELDDRDGTPLADRFELADDLAVTHANPARTRYEAYGFADALELFNVTVP